MIFIAATPVDSIVVTPIVSIVVTDGFWFYYPL